jgi:DNA polymerase III sliding clamp (beta) subunit (PCNA family)
MDTIQDNKRVNEGASVTYGLEVEGASLIELLEGAMTHADKGKNCLPALNSVQLVGEGGYLSARATDRYRAIEGKIEVIAGELSVSIVSLDDVKRVLAIAKEGKISNKVTLNRVGDLLTVSVNGSSITLTVLDVNYPPSFDDLFNKCEVTAIESIAFNPAYFADYGKIVGKGVQVQVTFNGQGKPITIGLLSDKVEWRALLMPMRVK